MVMVGMEIKERTRLRLLPPTVATERKEVSERDVKGEPKGKCRETCVRRGVHFSCFFSLPHAFRPSHRKHFDPEPLFSLSLFLIPFPSLSEQEEALHPLALRLLQVPPLSPHLPLRRLLRRLLRLSPAMPRRPAMPLQRCRWNSSITILGLTRLPGSITNRTTICSETMAIGMFAVWC